MLRHDREEVPWRPWMRTGAGRDTRAQTSAAWAPELSSRRSCQKRARHTRLEEERVAQSGLGAASMKLDWGEVQALVLEVEENGGVDGRL
jgi:hypothetical protein